MASTGQPWVTGVPPQIHTLKRQPIYDRERVGGAITQTSFFVDHQRFADGRTKTRNDTNMMLPGMLGVPFAFDLAQVVVYPTRSDDVYAEKYQRFVGSDALFRLMFGQHTVRFELPMAMMKPMSQSVHVRDEKTGKLMRVVVNGGKVEAHPVLKESSDIPTLWGETPKLTPRWYSVAVPDKSGRLVPRHIDSTESFRVDILSEKYGMSGDEVDVFVAFEGWLWAGP